MMTVGGGWCRAVRAISMLLAAALGVLGLTTGCGSPAGENTTRSAGITVYSNVSVIDPTGGTVRGGMAIVVDGERIRSVLPLRDAGIPASGTKVVDAKGAYALPGLIDAHVHLATDPNQRYAQALMRRDLYSGITAVRDMAGDTRALAELAEAARAKEIPAPDLFYAAVMAGPRFFDDPRTKSSTKGEVPGRAPWMRAVTDGTDIPKAVSDARGTGATGIKLYAELSGQLAQRITAEAHRQGMRVWSHAMLFPTTPSEVVDAGVDTVSHAGLLAYESPLTESTPLPTAYRDNAVPDAQLEVDGPVFGRLFERMRQHGTVFEPTLWVYDNIERWMTANPGQGRPPHSIPLDLAGRLTAAAHRAGIDIAAGTDFTTDREDNYPGLYRELEMLQQKAGLSPAEVLRSATLINAGTLGAVADMGDIRPGTLANFLLLTQNPLETVTNLRSITMTVKRGTAYPRQEYRPIAADEWQHE
ncbi:amidohydrolase family protein [Nocardia sp. NPDC052566]|uniref:amidohydrolase family protein n=1 Tax=Nocardia sp. NPDC052566 TaxID=3364330 RepID=UPI0037C5A17D